MGEGRGARGEGAEPVATGTKTKEAHVPLEDTMRSEVSQLPEDKHRRCNFLLRTSYHTCNFLRHGVRGGGGVVCLCGRPSLTGSRFRVTLKFRGQRTGGRRGRVPWAARTVREMPFSAVSKLGKLESSRTD